jgi:MFS family permease
MYSLSIAYANDRLEPEQIVPASASLVMVAGLGLSMGPIIVSYLMGNFGPTFFFVGIAVAFALILVFATHRMNITEAVAPEEQCRAVAAGVMGTPVAAYMAPDVEEYVEALVRNELEKLDKETEQDSTLDDHELDKYLQE